MRTFFFSPRQVKTAEQIQVEARLSREWLAAALAMAHKTSEEPRIVMSMLVNILGGRNAWENLRAYGINLEALKGCYRGGRGDIKMQDEQQAAAAKKALIECLAEEFTEFRALSSNTMKGIFSSS